MSASASVAIFWDYENCALPSLEHPCTLVNELRRLAHNYGSVKTFRAYLEYAQLSPKVTVLRSELQSCGVSLIDCPHMGRKDVCDKMILVDMMAYAIDTPAPATIILITGDGDFVYAISVLSLRRYHVVLLAPKAAHARLRLQAQDVYNWPEDLLIAQTPISPTPEHLGAAFKAAPLALENGSTERLASPDASSSSSSGDMVTQSPHSETRSNESSEGSEIKLTSPALTTALPRSLSLSIHAPTTPETQPTTIAALLPPAAPRHVPPPLNILAPPFALAPPLRAFSSPSQPEPRLRDRDRGSSSLLDDGPPAIPHTRTDTSPGSYTSAAQWGPAPPFRPSSVFFPMAPRLPHEFRPLVKVLKKRLAEGEAAVESSVVGQLLSFEGRLQDLYQRAGVLRLREYTTRAAELGIVTAREGVDGHQWLSLHPAYARGLAPAWRAPQPVQG